MKGVRLAAGLFVAALATDESSFAVGGAATFALGGPAVHFFHNRRLAGFGSFGLRGGVPVLGMLMGSSFADLNPQAPIPGVQQEESNGSEPILIGGLLGAAAASALDAGLLAYDKSPETRSALRAPPLGLSFALARQGGRVSVSGAF